MANPREGDFATPDCEMAGERPITRPPQREYRNKVPNNVSCCRWWLTTRLQRTEKAEQAEFATDFVPISGGLVIPNTVGERRQAKRAGAEGLNLCPSPKRVCRYSTGLTVGSGHHEYRSVDP